MIVINQGGVGSLLESYIMPPTYYNSLVMIVINSNSIKVILKSV